MPEVDETVITIADSYAEALLDLCEEQGVSDEMLEELGGLVEALEADRDLHRFLLSPAVDDDARREGLEQAFRGRASDLLVNLLQVLNAKGRTPILPTLYERFRLGLEDRRGEVDVYVTTAHPLSDEHRDRLKTIVGQRSGRTPRLVEQVDEGMIGGLVVQVGDEKLDCSVRQRLRIVAEMFRERASREIHAGKAYYEASDS